MVKRQIRDATDIVDLVGNYMTLRRAGASFKGLCPFHEEKTPSFNVHPARQTFKCYGCGAGGDVFSFVQLKENLSFVEALRMLAERAGIPLETQTAADRSGPGKQDLARVNQWAQQVFRQQYAGSEGQAARDYVARRGIAPEMADGFGIGFALDSYDALLNRAQASRIGASLMEAAGLVKRGGRSGCYDTFRNRLMFPIVDATGRIIGFGGRTLGDDPAKYLNSPTTVLFDKGTNVFGLNLARQAMATAGRAIVVEGYTDCIMAHQFGFGETVATLGTAMTEAHASLLRRYTDRLVLLFDSDEAGQRASDRAIGVTLTSGLDVTLARVPAGKDPCDYLLLAGRDGLESVLKQGLGALEFKWNLVAREYQASSTGPGRRRAIDAYLQQLAAWLGRGVIDPIQKGLLVNQLSKVLGVPAEDLRRQLDQLGRRTAGRSPAASAETSDVARPMADAPVAVGAEQRALLQVVEVLLNEPGLFPVVQGCFEPTAIRDRRVAPIAVELVSMLRSGEPFQISDLIGRFESPEYGRLITDLQTRGERRGGYQGAIEGALPWLHSLQERRGTAGSLPADEDARLLKLAEVARTPRFSTMKARKRFCEGG
ncbi:MAG: DNA primase [Planctomycetes bacterium]|nr:DNA primase [Planctomycetota bacterium]